MSRLRIFSSRCILAFGAVASFHVLSAAERGESGTFRAELSIDAEPASERRDAVRRATLGDEVEIHVSFENPSLDKEGLSGVLMDSVIRRPDGSIVCEHRNLTGWAGVKPAPQGEIIDADCHLELKPELEDPPGRYTVEVRVKDIPAKKTITLTSVIEFVEGEKK